MMVDILLPDVIELKHIAPGETFMAANHYYIVTGERTTNYITVVNLENGDCLEFPAHKKVRRETFKVVKL